MIRNILATLVVFIIPVIGALFLKVEKNVKISNFIIGALTFLISQVLIRLPLLNYLGRNTNIFTMGFLSKMIPYIMFFSFTAGIFEECGRYISYKFFLKDENNLLSPISFGLGHGGFEASHLVLPLVYKSIMHPLFYGNLVGYLVIIERVFAIIFHIAASIIIFYGVKTKRKIWLLISILLHGTYNFTVVYVAQITKNPILAEAVGAVMVVMYLILGIILLKKLKEEKNYEEED